MYDESIVEELLDSLLPAGVSDQAEAASRLMAAVTVINRDWEQTLVGKPVTSVSVEEPRLRKWMARLLERAAGYAEASGADGFSVNVGWPAGAGVRLDRNT